MAVKKKIIAWCLRRRFIRTIYKDANKEIDLGQIEITDTPQGPLINVEYSLIPEDDLTIDAVHVSGSTRDYVDVSAVIAKFPRSAVITTMTAHDHYTFFMDDTIRNAADELANHASKEGQTDMIRVMIYAGVAIVVALFLMFRVWA